MRDIAWVKAARKEFETFPAEARERFQNAIAAASAGRFPDDAKPLRGFDAAVFEIALAYRSDAYRVVYALKLGSKLWVVHAFQKKSTKGIKTPQREIDLIHGRIRFIRSQLP
jgi:phage-related protein